eukprot:CAMPEP_0197637400 /NCGR_PEP_ID=MMETSP1338-20131121/12637_1 /TAXON_ID=43686 ORGANISM="Pelagodinium beii, Strain RCC1491" /NCGR_SAMPLE_ID=MMETSP1338 /ASSEMBLY_ACC=CAM_ASM_000754 /LENGTH=1270 /DNA_ID=CAMNT_0043209821 /DNA_START=41 /DNA_END=3853 /DNA_ORIENTATION=-
MKVFVKALVTGRTFEVEVESTDTVEILKQHVEENEGSPSFQQRLIFQGKHLRDGATLGSAGLQNGRTVHLVLKLASSIAIVVKTMTGKSIEIPVKPSDTVSQVTQTLEHLLQIPNGTNRLNFAGRQLMDEEVLGKIPIPDKAVLLLIRLPLPQATNPSSRSAEQDRIRVYGDLGTLYARCGGIFGVAGFADRCMDKWMADSTLNSNEAVASWHARAQRCGFKFLVTQLMAYLTGGPHRYTGRPLAEAHKHLNITGPEWEVFMAVFRSVCQEFALPSADTEDLIAILQSTEQDCVVHPGEDVPPNPGPVHHDDKTLYALLGGVYPIALFTDRLVDAMLADKRVKIPVDGQKRNEASLKYLFTELVCNITGGPEILTAELLPETRLLITGRTFFYLLDAAKDASDHLAPQHRAELIQRLSKTQHLIVDPKRQTRISDVMRERQSLVEALGQKLGMDLLYVPGGGLVKLDFAATEIQVRAVQDGLAKLGFKTVEKTRVKSAGEAAAGNMLSSATIANRYAAPGAFVASRKRVHGDPQTLYGRGGGIFGLAKLADQLMDGWMADPALNANAKVAQWNESQQKCGFKFLVTQIFGYLTGGPQRYTGQPMDIAHKHLGITAFQWDAFMRGLDMVCGRSNMDAATHRELRGIVSSFRDQIIIQEGELAPADPGLCRKPPAGNSLYAQAGGVYPLAQFADRLVEACLQQSSLQISWDRATDAKGKRTAAGLKYLVTELICSGAGGPEVVTSRGFDDAKLGVPAEKWEIFKSISAEAAASVWFEVEIKEAILVVLEEQKAEICSGLVQEDLSEAAQARRRLREAGYSHLETTAALSRCHGDAEEALALLVSGWTPQQLAVASPAPAAYPDPAASQLRCPFSGMAAGSSGSCPFTANAQAAQSLPKRTRTEASSSSVGRILGSVLQDSLDELMHEDPELSCPITLVLFIDPVVASDGCVYEKDAIQEVLRTQGLSPTTHKPLSPQLFPAQEAQERVRCFMLERGGKLLEFAKQALQQSQAGMLRLVCDRIRDYLAVLTPAAAPFLLSGLEELYGLGCPRLHLPAPNARIQQFLGRQVQQANADAACKPQGPPKTDAAGKTVAFTVDVSGSMRGLRMEKARENLLKIFDDYIEDEDQLTMLTFDHSVTVQFELQMVAANREALRRTAENACRVAGGTAFYDALIKTVEVLGTAEPGNQWIIALTDGADQHSKNSIFTALARIKAAAGQPNLIIVGIQLSDQVKPLMEKLATATEKSIFIDASGGLESLDDAFQQVAELICE